MTNTYTQEELALCKKHGDVTLSGIAFQRSSEGTRNERYTILREPQHTDEEIDAARREIESDYDVNTRITVRRPLPAGAHVEG